MQTFFAVSRIFISARKNYFLNIYAVYLNFWPVTVNGGETVTPVAEKPRRISFTMRNKVTANIDDLMKKGKIERVEGPTSCVSPMVVTPEIFGYAWT